MIHFSCEKLGSNLIRILDGSDVCDYLVLGTERAALIDTSYGVGDLKGYVETLTDKPYDVFITHGHVDHASGAEPFETVYMNPADTELYRERCGMEYRRPSITMRGIYPDLEEQDFHSLRTKPFLPLSDGMQFDLGGETIRWVAVPGHTQGTMVPILEKSRIAIFGDACGVGVLLVLPECSTVEAYCESLKHLQTFELMYDKVLRQHGTMESSKQVLEDNIENCENILKGTDAAEKADFRGKPCLRAAKTDPKTGKRLDGREGNILYFKERIR